MSKKFLFCFLLFIFIILIKNHCFGAIINRSYTNDEGSFIDYEFHSETQHYINTIKLPDRFSENPYLIIIHDNGVPYMYVNYDITDTQNYYFKFTYNNNSTNIKYWGCQLALRNSLDDSLQGLSEYKYDFDTKNWISLSDHYYYNPSCAFSPTGYLYSNMPYSIKHAFKNDVPGLEFDVYKQQFIPGEPRVELLSDEYYKVFLDCFIEGYTMEDDFLSITDTKYKNFLFKITDLDDNDDAVIATTSSILDYIHDGYLDIPLMDFKFDENTYYVNWEKDHTYKFEFQVDVVFRVSIGDYYYDQYYVIRLDDMHKMGTGVSIDDPNKDSNKELLEKQDELLKKQDEAMKQQQQQHEELLEQQKQQHEEELAQQKEQNETSKGIWGTLKDLLSYINPFSENFFAYKLVELIIDGITNLLKFLFIPEDDFFSNWFSDMNDTFKDQFGILYYPVSVIIEFLSTLDNSLSSHEPIINTPEFRLSFMNFNVILLPAFHYNFNDLLDNETFNRVHTFYLLFVNIVFTIGLIAFASKVATEIFGGIDDSVDTAVYNSQAQTRANNSYARQQEAKKNYARRK